MIPKNVRPGAYGENLGDGESRAFTIQANGQAFKTLIDGLYSNKVRAVIRELCSNAMDSHIDSGNKRPFKVSIPTTLDPTFRIRDYGTSLSHNDMMALYTTIFQSTKTGTNEQTGQLGLGSKSPFAYTDAFTVAAYMEGAKRSYLAYLAEDGVPSLKYLGSTPTTEPQGLEVTFAAKHGDIPQFQREMQFVAMGYTVTPEVEGMRVKLQEPRASGSNWAIYPTGAFGDDVRHNHFIRQGSALYPSDTSFPNVGYGWITIVEVPIGTAAVAASREALSYDNDTRTAVRKVHEVAYGELKSQIDAKVKAATTRRQSAMVYKEYNGLLTNMRGNSTVPIWKDEMTGRTGVIPGDVLEDATHFGKSMNTRGAYNRFKSQFEVHHLDTMIVLVNDTETKVVRRVKRMREAALHNAGLVYVLDEPIAYTPIDGTHELRRQPAIDWLKKCLELRDDQFVLVSSLPDCPPAKRASGAAKKPPRLLAAGQYWMSRQDGRVISDIYGQSDRGYGEWPKQMRQAMIQAKLGVAWENVFFVTEKQEETYTKKGQLPADRKFDVVIKRSIEKAVEASPLDDAQTMQTVLNMVGSYNRALPVVLAEFFPNLKITEDKTREVLALAELAKIDLRNRPIVAKINNRIRELTTQFPLLFQKSDRSHFEHYVTAVKASQKAEVSQ